MNRQRVRLKDVAEQVGLSVAAVSMALSGNPRIGAETAAEVRRVADELGYVTNVAGRALRASQTGAIALIVPNTSQHVLDHAYFLHVLTGINEVTTEHDAQLLLSTNSDEFQGEVAYDRVMRAGWVDGAIVTSAAIGDPGVLNLTQNGMPVVLLGRYPELPHAVTVGIDDRAASKAITSHLIRDHGRKALVHISGPLQHRSAKDRKDGFIDACEEFGVQGTVLQGDYEEKAGYELVQDLPRGSFDALVSANDEMAFGAIVRFREEGIDVPEEVAVVGFDDFSVSRVATPSITTVRVPVVAMAREATRLLIDLVGGNGGVPSHTELPVEIVPRESCGCAAADLRISKFKEERN